MKTVGIKILENKLSEYVRIAASGETVLITDRDRVVAQITAPNATSSPILADARLADAVRKGWLTPAAGPNVNLPPKPAPIGTLADVLMELDEDRSDR